MVLGVDADGVGEGDRGGFGAVREDGVVDLVEVDGVLLEDLGMNFALALLLGGGFGGRKWDHTARSRSSHWMNRMSSSCCNPIIFAYSQIAILICSRVASTASTTSASSLLSW